MQDTKTNIFALTKQDTAVLKGIAIIAMLMHHLYGCAPVEYMPDDAILSYVGDLGKVCVAMFLFCSGYGLSVGYGGLTLDPSPEGEGRLVCIQRNFVIILKFLVKRFVKFYAGYWPIFLIFVPIGVFIFDRPLSVPYGEDSNILKCLVLDTLGLQGFSSYNITWWFNKLIISLYFLFPFLYKWARKNWWSILLISILAMRLCYRFKGCFLEDVCLYSCPFVLGILWQQHQEKMNIISQWSLSHGWEMLSVAMSLLLILLILRMNPIIPHWTGIRIDGFLACAIVLCYKSLQPIISMPKVSLLAYLGKHSMNIYMIHTFIFSYWFARGIYSCEVVWGGAFFALLMVCLIISVVMEWIKEISLYNKLLKFVINII